MALPLASTQAIPAIDLSNAVIPAVATRPATSNLLAVVAASFHAPPADLRALRNLLRSAVVGGLITSLIGVGVAVAGSGFLVGAGVAPGTDLPALTLALARVASRFQSAAVISPAPASRLRIHATTAALSVLPNFRSLAVISRVDSFGFGVGAAVGLGVLGVVTNRARITALLRSIGLPDRRQLSTADWPPR
jgi:hypothetical protein|tara:strand:+ start:2759 stop:3334 length:576 start_codon:yes stop_codon:yes gene_type:complete